MANGDCPIGARNGANIENLEREVRDMETRLRCIETESISTKARHAVWGAVGAFVATAILQLVFKFIG